jgi:hypothetical protein
MSQPPSRASSVEEEDEETKRLRIDLAEEDARVERARVLRWEALEVLKVKKAEEKVARKGKEAQEARDAKAAQEAKEKAERQRSAALGGEHPGLVWARQHLEYLRPWLARPTLGGKGPMVAGKKRGREENAEAGPSNPKRARSIDPPPSQGAASWRKCDRCRERGLLCTPPIGSSTTCPPCQTAKKGCTGGMRPADRRERTSVRRAGGKGKGKLAVKSGKSPTLVMKRKKKN